MAHLRNRRCGDRIAAVLPSFRYVIGGMGRDMNQAAKDGFCYRSMDRLCKVGLENGIHILKNPVGYRNHKEKADWQEVLTQSPNCFLLANFSTFLMIARKRF